MCHQYWNGHWEIVGACPIAYALWQGTGLNTIGELYRSFRTTLAQVRGYNLGRDYASSSLIEWLDRGPRDVVLESLLPEVERSLAMRGEHDAT